MDMMIPHTPFSLSHLLFSSLRHCPPPVRLAPTTRTRNGLSPSQEITPSLPVCMGGYYIADTDDDEDDNHGDDDMYFPREFRLPQCPETVVCCDDRLR